MVTWQPTRDEIVSAPTRRRAFAFMDVNAAAAELEGLEILEELESPKLDANRIESINEKGLHDRHEKRRQKKAAREQNIVDVKAAREQDIVDVDAAASELVPTAVLALATETKMQAG